MMQETICNHFRLRDFREPNCVLIFPAISCLGRPYCKSGNITWQNIYRLPKISMTAGTDISEIGWSPFKKRNTSAAKQLNVEHRPREKPRDHCSN